MVVGHRSTVNKVSDNLVWYSCASCDHHHVVALQIPYLMAVLTPSLHHIPYGAVAAKIERKVFFRCGHGLWLEGVQKYWAGPFC
jgi:hypothetical protein